MKTRRRIGWAVGVVALLAAGWLLFGRSNEPHFEGKSLSFWFKEYCLAHVSTNEATPRYELSEITEAIREMGTNALPFLVKTALNTNEDSKAKIFFYNLADKLPESWRPTAPVRRSQVREAAAKAIDDMDASAKILLLLLGNALETTSDRTKYWSALRIFKNTEKDADILVRHFASALGDETFAIESLFALRRLGPQAKDAVPELVALLRATQGTNEFLREFVQIETVATLGSIGSNAAPALPILRGLFDGETNEDNRCALAVALCKIDGRQTEALNFLIGGLKAPWSSNDNSWLFFNSLGEIGSNASPAIPALVEAIGAVDFGSWIRAAYALEAIGAPGEAYLAKLREKLTDASDESRLYAAGVILNHDEKDAAAQSVLEDMVKRHSQIDVRAITYLGSVGPAASNAIPTIMTAFDGTNLMGWYWAADSLKRMGTPVSLYLPKLKEKLNSKDEHVRLVMARKILDVTPDDHDSHVALIEIIRSNPDGAVGAFFVLANAGPAARAAIPVLKEAQKSKRAKIRRAATYALTKIEAKPERKD